jgi:UDP-N-acetylmuramyl pentapeptide synthase
MLRTTGRDAFCVIEVAASGPGSVAQTGRLLRPRIAVVTNIGSDHRRTFRTYEATAAEKRSLLDAVVDGGTAVLNADDPHVIAMAEGFPGRVIRFGCSPNASLRAEDVRSPWPERLSFTLRCDGRSLPVRTMLCGKHWVSGVLAALGVASAMGVALEQAVEALATVPPTPGRMSPVSWNGVTFIRDDIKAPLWGFDAAFEFLTEARAARKLAVIGTISDYPGDSARKYRSVARRALEIADEVVFAGPNARHALKEGRTAADSLHAFPTARAAGEHLLSNLREGDLVLLKGSAIADHLRGIVDMYQRA